MAGPPSQKPHAVRSAPTTVVQRIKRRPPEASDEELVRELEKQYLITVGTLGAAAGGAAAVPIFGSSASLAMSAAEIGAFVDATVLFTLAVAEVHGVGVADLELRRALVLAVLLGEIGTAIVEDAGGRPGVRWGKLLAQGMPANKIETVNRLLGRKLLTKFASRQGALVLGRALPFGIGAAIGASGNTALGYAWCGPVLRPLGRG